MATTQTLRKLFQIVVGATDTLVYAAPSLTTVVVCALYKLNADTVARTLRLYAVDPGGSIALANALYYDEPLAPKRVHPRIDTGLMLGSGAMLRAVASAGSVVVLTGFGIILTETS